MKYVVPKYVITLRGEGKQFDVSLCHSSVSKRFIQNYVFGKRILERALGQPLPARLADFLELTSSVYFGDRMALRCPRGWFDCDRRHWKRELHVIMPVRDLAFWRQPSVVERLTAVLDYATEDRWHFSFEPLGPMNKSYQLEFAFRTPKNTCVTLFSGGLDAFVGTLTHLKQYRPDRAFLISAVTNRCMLGVQRRQVDALKAELHLDLVHVPVELHFKERTLSDHLEEKTQRSRGFLYTAIGAVLAHLTNKDELYLFENGIGALNLPITDFQVGTDNTRATNPLALLDISKLFSLIFEKPFEIKNPALWLTKAELCQALGDSSLAEVIRKTISCDGSFSRRVRRKRQCGVCASCLLRRQSLTAAGLSGYDSAEDYQFDIYTAAVPPNDRRLFNLHAMRIQIDRFHYCLKSSNAWFEFSRRYPMLEEIKLRLGQLSNSKMEIIQQKVLRLYSNYVQEWGTFETRLS